MKREFTSGVYREVHCEDALKWLKTIPTFADCIITSLPDPEEIGIKKQSEYLSWLHEATGAIQYGLKPDGVVFFYQTDRRIGGRVIDKKYFISECFYDLGYSLILSKIVLKQAVGVTNLFRPTFSNLFAFSLKQTSAKASPDVIEAGRMVYKNAMGFNVVKNCIEFLQAKKMRCDTILDPFCGRGSVLKIANDLGYNAIGVDIDSNQINYSFNI